MKLLPTLVATAGIAAALYLACSINNAVRVSEAKIDLVLADSAKWHAETDQLNKRLDKLPQTATELVKASARQGTKEVVGVPAEAGKTIVKNVADTGEKAYKDTAREITHFFEHL
jgi:outer membrane murein-binding lipoprotein Lpp